MTPVATATLAAGGRAWRYVDLAQAEGPLRVSRLPYVLRIVLENLLRQALAGTLREGELETLRDWPRRTRRFTSAPRA